MSFMSAQDHALRVHSSLCRIWDELVHLVEELPADGSYPRPQILQNVDSVVLGYPNCCSYVISADGSAVCREHTSRNDDVSTPDGALRVAYDLVRYLTSNSYPVELNDAADKLLEEMS